MRYLVVARSQSGHCCFEHTVVDTTKPVIINGEHYNNQYASVCECFDEDEAILVRDALNRGALEEATLSSIGLPQMPARGDLVITTAIDGPRPPQYYRASTMAAYARAAQKLALEAKPLPLSVAYSGNGVYGKLAKDSPLYSQPAEPVKYQPVDVEKSNTSVTVHFESAEAATRWFASVNAGIALRENVEPTVKDSLTVAEPVDPTHAKIEEDNRRAAEQACNVLALRLGYVWNGEDWVLHKPAEPVKEKPATLLGREIGREFARVINESMVREPVKGPSDFPLGAIENGRVFAERVESAGFVCEAGNLNLCSDWQEFKRCFEYLAEWAMGQPAQPAVKYAPVDSKLRDQNYRHPNDNEPRTEACQAVLDSMGDSVGQGLDGYWKWGFAAGFNAALAQPAASAEPVDATLAAHTDLLTYVLQDDVHNRLTPRVIDIAHTAFMCAKKPNSEDGGASDWFNDTKPVVTLAIEKLRKDLFAERAPAPQPVEPVAEQLTEAVKKFDQQLRTLATARMNTVESNSEHAYFHNFKELMEFGYEVCGLVTTGGSK